MFSPEERKEAQSRQMLLVRGLVFRSHDFFLLTVIKFAWLRLPSAGRGKIVGPQVKRGRVGPFCDGGDVNPYVQPRKRKRWQVERREHPMPTGVCNQSRPSAVRP